VINLRPAKSWLPQRDANERNSSLDLPSNSVLICVPLFIVSFHRLTQPTDYLFSLPLTSLPHYIAFDSRYNSLAIPASAGLLLRARFTGARESEATHGRKHRYRTTHHRRLGERPCFHSCRRFHAPRRSRLRRAPRRLAGNSRQITAIFQRAATPATSFSRMISSSA